MPKDVCKQYSGQLQCLQRSCSVTVSPDVFVCDGRPQQLLLQAESFRARNVLYFALSALKKHAERSQLAHAVLRRMVHKQFASAWAAWTIRTQASIAIPLHDRGPTLLCSMTASPNPNILGSSHSTMHAMQATVLHHRQSLMQAAQEMAQRRMAAEALQRRALSRMQGLSLRSSYGAWRRHTARVSSARGLLRRRLLALQQEAFTAWRCARCSMRIANCSDRCSWIVPATLVNRLAGLGRLHLCKQHALRPWCLSLKRFTSQTRSLTILLNQACM